MKGYYPYQIVMARVNGECNAEAVAEQYERKNPGNKYVAVKVDGYVGYNIVRRIPYLAEGR